MTIIAEHQHSKLTSSQLTKLRARLVKDREQTLDFVAQLRADVDVMRSSRQDVPTDDEHDPEGPTLAFERSQASAVLDTAMAHFASIESALERVDGENFGICARCDRRIPFARLEARPYTEYCVDCAS